MSVFSFVWGNNSTEFAELAIKWLTPSLSLSFVLRDCDGDLLLEDKSLSGILTNYPKEKFLSFPTFFLVFKSFPNCFDNETHILYFNPKSISVNCLREFKYYEVEVDLSRLLRDITISFFSDIGCRNPILSAALFTPKNSVFPNTVYFSLAIKFLYPYFSEFSSAFSDVEIEFPSDYLWGDIIPSIVNNSRLTPESVLEYVRSLCQKNGYFSKTNDEQYVKNVMRIFLKTDNAYTQLFFYLPVVSMILERFIFPHLSFASASTDIFLEECNDVRYSKFVLNALAEFQPRVLRALMESSRSVLGILEHLLHLQSLCGDLSIFDDWIKQSFSLYCHCLDQLGHSSIVLPSQIFNSGGRNRDIDFYVERFERSITSSTVPRLFYLAIKAARFQIRQMILSKPLPRLSFSSQLHSLSILSPDIKKFVQIERF
ncbi:unnamed protein product [Hymenolepis diminuta]|uniref:Uncharacterized protein n=1 Tax=Hymenolepis diminuta TaxID=6216 RepID=A0A0R3SMZ6_HYMDI|nr:unnamed protein product [Hymenolepis diminuta]